MKTLNLALAILPGLCRGTGHPILQYDPDTISPCVVWVDNANDLVCEDVRSYWGITAEKFSDWNPSVGLDCTPWIVASYCVVPLERLPETSTSVPAPTTTITTTSSSPTLRPSPTSFAPVTFALRETE